MVVYHRDAKVTPCEPGVERRVLAYNEKVMMCEIHFDAGAEGYLHSHVHEQVSYVKTGEFVFTIDGESNVVKEGDSVLIPSGAEHGVLARTEGILVDVFSPMRETFV
ncbi:MAG: cupin domain-containing protein [Clostridia bacterium]|nr:cupin domain-containing protein [Clostridia bacterium]MBQ4157121.1 cupin domain-containing protein [Clostridia bacterium]